MGVVNRANPRDEQSNGVQVLYIKGALEQYLRRRDMYLSKDVRETVLDEPRGHIKTGKFQIDIKINNASIGKEAVLQDITPEDFTKVYAVNFLGPILVLKV